jgi:hypothetical protein
MRPRGLLVAPILLLGACRPPAQPAPDREASLEAAARAAAASTPAALRGDFTEGFRMGARMVWEATLRHRTPWLPRMGEAGPAPLPEAARAMGAVAEDPGPRIELDAATGFPIRFLDPAAGGFGPGEVAGFSWALAPVRQDLCRPTAPPVFPEGEAWRTWQPQGNLLSTPGLEIRVHLVGNALLWAWEGDGFPPRHGWRRAPGWLVPRALALRDRALWIATEAHGAVALDLETGLVTALRAGGPLAPESRDQTWEAGLKQEQTENLRERPQRLARAERGEPAAMLELAWAAEEPRERAAWFRKAAEAGDADGMYELGVLFYQGRGVTEDKQEARQWFERAARAGNAKAREVLAGLFKQPGTPEGP